MTLTTLLSWTKKSRCASIIAGVMPSPESVASRVCCMMPSATAKVTRSVTPITRPMVARDDRPGARIAFRPASRTTGSFAPMRPMSWSTGGITIVAPTATPAKDTKPPRAAGNTAIGDAALPRARWP